MMKRLASIISALVFIVVLAGCGGQTQSYQESGNLSVNEVLEPTAEPLPTLTSSPTGSNAAVPEQRTWNVEHRTSPPWHDFLNSPHYSGFLSMMFREGTNVRLRDGKWSTISPRPIEVISVPQSFSPEVESLNRAVLSHGGIIHRGMDIEEETMEAALIKASKEGKKLHDWNLYYTIEVEDPDAAEGLWDKFAKSSVVAWTHPIPKMYPLGGLGPTPDLISKQGYLDSEQATGGLNIYPAWNKGISGQGVRLADAENNWNLNHEDLPIDESDVIGQYDPALGGQDSVQHGTAVTGILGGKDNGLGVKGISHSSHILVGQGAMFAVKESIEYYVNGGRPDVIVRPGDVIVIEVGTVGEATPNGCTVDNNTKQPTNCMPVEAYNDAFNAIEDATTLGVVVVEGAANGGADLSDPAVQSHLCGQYPCPDLAVDDSGAIMVAASNGGKDNTKPWWSNWGKRINAYAWGYGVTTTGYGVDFDQNWQPHPNTDSDPNDQNRWYTNSFNGTSSATALVAGAVTLVQSYTREYYRHTSTYDPQLQDIVTHKQVYLDAWQIRKLIELAGVSCDPNYNIGYKPDVGKMFELIEQGAVIPHVAPDNAALISPKYAVAGVRYDMDGDKRAELISWTPPDGGAGGLWKIDLSTIAPRIANPDPDNYGDWDLRIEFQMDDAIDSGIFFPVVHDYDSDGDADLSIYDSKNGKWYIKYITPAIIARASNGTLRLDWDVILDYSSDPLWKSHARPLPGDYNGDNFLDTAIVRADGHWAIDYGGIGRLVRNGGIEYKTDFRGFEKDVVFLTPQQLQDAPGWGYLPAMFSWESGACYLFKMPDGTPSAGKLGGGCYPDFIPDDFANLATVYGDNDDILVMMTERGPRVVNHLSIKGASGIWGIAWEGSWDDIQNPISPLNGYSEMLCLPVMADYDGDTVDDRAVKCGSRWKIAISDFNTTDFRIVTLNDDPMSLPPTIYPGGIKYQDIRSILNYYNLFNAYRDKDPFTPYTVDCMKYWGVPPEYCLAPK